MKYPSSIVASLCLLLAACPGDDATTPAPAASSTGVDANTETTNDIEDTESTGPAGNDSTDDPPGTTDDTTAGGGGACAPSGGTHSTSPTMTDDPFGHLMFLLMFFNPDTMDATGTEQVMVTTDGGMVSLMVPPRDSGSGSGHMGIEAVSGPLNDDCSFDVMGEVPYASDSGDFGMIMVQWTGVAAQDQISATMSMSGGGIPSGPITFTLLVDLP